MKDSSGTVAVDDKITTTVEEVKIEKKHQSDALDEALKESFPASDPVAIDFKKAKKTVPPQDS